MLEKIDELLKLLVGEFVWSVRRGHGTFLTMEFGNPHIVVREPVDSTSEDRQVTRILARRKVSIVGDSSLWIRDSQWSLSSSDGFADLNSSEAAVQEMLWTLDGQKLSNIHRSDQATALEFDLGVTLRLGKSIFPEESASVLWTLARYNDTSLSLLNDGSTNDT